MLPSAFLVTSLGGTKLKSVSSVPSVQIEEFEKYMQGIIPSEAEIRAFTSKEIHEDMIENNHGWTYNSELGWILKNSVRDRGVDGSLGFYRYEKNGSRKIIDHFDVKRPRIQSYGNSFTHCDQVSDGETWQHYLSSHFREPIENFGVGGYGVYQAFLRYKHIQKTSPAEYIILNIWSDDHFRSLDSWRSIRFGKRTFGGYTLPYVRVDRKDKKITIFPNICPDEESLYQLRSIAFLKKHFYNDEVCLLALTTKIKLKRFTVPVSIGLAQGNTGNGSQDILKNYVEDALYSSQRIIEWFEDETKARGQKFALILSHSRQIIQNEIMGKPRWDQSLLDYLKTKSYPVIDLRDAHSEDFKNSKLDFRQYVGQFYIGHYAPRGNYFFANALRNPLRKWLQPPPRPYRRRE